MLLEWQVFGGINVVSGIHLLHCGPRLSAPRVGAQCPSAHRSLPHRPHLCCCHCGWALWIGPRWRTGREVATGLYGTTALSAVVSYYSGTWAIDTITIATPEAAQTLSAHSYWAWYTMVSTGAHASARAISLFLAHIRSRRLLHAVFFVVGLGILFPIYKTGENGGEMVYQRGVGVTQTQELPDDLSVPDSTRQDTVWVSR